MEVNRIKTDIYFLKIKDSSKVQTCVFATEPSSPRRRGSRSVIKAELVLTCFCLEKIFSYYCRGNDKKTMEKVMFSNEGVNH